MPHDPSPPLSSDPGATRCASDASTGVIVGVIALLTGLFTPPLGLVLGAVAVFLGLRERHGDRRGNLAIGLGGAAVVLVALWLVYSSTAA